MSRRAGAAATASASMSAPISGRVDEVETKSTSVAASRASRSLHAAAHRAPGGCQGFGAGAVPVHHRHPGDPVRPQRLQNPFGHRAGPEDQRAATGESSRHRGRHIDSRRADRGRVASEHRLPPHPAPRGERTDEHGVEQMVGGPRRLRRLVRPPHLPQDLALAEDLGIETRGDGVEVPDRRRAIEPGHRLVALGPARPREVLEPLAEIVVAAPVHLAAIAGGEEHRAPAGEALRRQPGIRLRRSQREVLPHLDAGGMVAHANDMEGWFVAHDPNGTARRRGRQSAWARSGLRRITDREGHHGGDR